MGQLCWIMKLNYIILFVLMAKKLVVKHPFNTHTIRLQGITQDVVLILSLARAKEGFIVDNVYI